MHAIGIYSVIISVRIVAVYILFQEGMIFHFIRVAVANKLDKLGYKASRYIQKPLWDCLPCMGGLWTIIWIMFDNTYSSLKPLFVIMFIVIGLNALVERTFFKDEDYGPAEE